MIIPARMASRRLPGKPLADIAGQPMIAHVVARALAAAIGPVWVATDSAAVADAARRAGAAAVPTHAHHVSGTDRAAEALATLDPARRFDPIVNCQGDEPEIDPTALRAVLGPLADAGVDIATLAAPLAPGDAADPDAVKVSGQLQGPDRIEVDAFFRSPPSPAQVAWRHIGVYAFRRSALERFVALPPSANEGRERLEQLRALDAGMRMVAVLVEGASRGVDTPADLDAVRARFEARLGEGPSR